jgi:hypothetical protein
VLVVHADSPEAFKQILAAYRRAWPPPNLTAERLMQALAASSVDERRELTVAEAERVAAALVALGRHGTAADLRLAIDSARNADRLAMRGFVARAEDGTLAYFAHALADGIKLDGDVLKAAEQAPRWSVPRRWLPGEPE